MKDNVKFYRDKGGVFAYFPEITACIGFETSYAHIGQHGACSKGYIKECTEVVDESEYIELKEELEQLGYKLNVL